MSQPCCPTNRLKPLDASCKACREAAVAITRQRAILNRPAGQWYQVCAQHVPGSRLGVGGPNRFHEVQAAR